MRQMISGFVAALGVAAASAGPAMACGFTPCEQTYVPTYSPAYGYAGCATGCNSGWAFERLAEPTTQYYYVNQGPTYTGPGAFAPVPTYQESAVSVWGERPAVYGYRWNRHHPLHSYRYGSAPHFRHAMRYGYMPHH